MEAPHVAEMVSKVRYRNFMGVTGANRLLKIEFTRIRKHSDFLYSVYTRFDLQRPDDERRTFTKIDRWVKVRGLWYHDLRDVVMFPQLQ
jgi:hypothetical protein